MNLVATPEHVAWAEMTRKLLGMGEPRQTPLLTDRIDPGPAWTRPDLPATKPSRPLRSKDEVMAPFFAAKKKGQDFQAWLDSVATDPNAAPVKAAGDVLPLGGYEPEGIDVEGAPSQLREGVLKGAFSAGRTGGNILGILGDAFLTQAGHAPRYAPRLREARESEALAGFFENPQTAIERLMDISPDKALAQHQNQAKNAMDQARIDISGRSADLDNRKFTEEYENNTHARAGALIGAATEDNYAEMRKRYYDYYKARGVAPFVELPETFEEAKLEALRRSGVPLAKQEEIDVRRDYNDAMIESRGEAEQGRNARSAASISARERITGMVQDRQDARQARSIEARAAGKGGRAKPKIKFKIVNGKRQIVR